MDRRTFLERGTLFLAGSILGIGSASKVFAFVSPAGETNHPAPRMALIIDDIGYSTSAAESFLELGIPLTFSILPRLPKTRELAEAIPGLGHETMLHQPMEPYNNHLDPGPGAVYVGDRRERITAVVAENMAQVQGVVGVNNHMGSRFTSFRKDVDRVLGVVESKGLFFVDSLTSSHSVAYKAAQRRRMPSACRNVFLDNSTKEKDVVAQLHKLQDQALKRGRAIGIGHPHRVTAGAIGKFAALHKDPSVSFVHISKIVQGGSSAG